MDCTATTAGHWEAVLHLSAGIDPQIIHQALTNKKIRNFVDAGADSTALIIPDLTNEKQLLSLLHESGWTKGEPETHLAQGETTHTPNRAQAFIKEQPVLLSALFYELADVAWIASGIQRARHNRSGKFTPNDMSELMIGVVMGLGDLVLGLYGKDKTKPPMIAFADALDQHLKEDGIIVLTGDNVTPDSIHKSGYFASVNKFLEKNSVAVKSTVKVLGGGLMMHSALKKGNFNQGKLAGGFMLSAGYLPLLFLDDPHPAPFAFKTDDATAHQPKEHSGLGWFAQNPRARITAPLAIGNNIAKLWGALGESQKYSHDVRDAQNALSNATPSTLPTAQADLRWSQARQYDYGWNVLTACSNIVGNYLFGLSGKKKTSYISDEPERFHHEMTVVAANVLNNVPEKMRKQAIEDTAAYIANIKGVKETPDEIAAAIATEAERLQHQIVTSQGR